jgi:hypothetical protein
MNTTRAATEMPNRSRIVPNTVRMGRLLLSTPEPFAPNQCHTFVLNGQFRCVGDHKNTHFVGMKSSPAEALRPPEVWAAFPVAAIRF